MRRRSGTLKHWWKRCRARSGARRAIRGQLLAADWPEVRTAYNRLRAAGLSDRQAVGRLVAVLERETDRMVDHWRPFDRAAYATDLAALS